MLGALALAGVIAFTQSPGIAVAREGIAPHQVFAYGFAPSWTASGRRLAIVFRGDVWAIDADGTHAAQLTRTETPEDDPSWSPDGRQLVYERDGAVWLVWADGSSARQVVRDATDPAWSPDGTRIAFVRDGDLFDVRLDTHVVHRLTETVETEAMPAWSPDGHRIAFERNGSIWLVGGDGTGSRRLATGRDPAWQPLPRRPELLPDVVERPPTSLRISLANGRWLLGFTTAVDNVGDGAFVVVGRRAPGSAVMDAAQRVTLSPGRYRVYPKVGLLHYENVGQHHHWHFQPYERYELRTLDGTVVVRDHKQGFCLADHYGVAPGVPHRPPVFLDSCASGNPLATALVEGTSLGYTDIYPAYFHGQSLDLTGVPGGQYLLVNRVNPFLRFRELRYDNDAATLSVRIAWPGGPKAAPKVTVLRACRAAICAATSDAD